MAALSLSITSSSSSNRRLWQNQKQLTVMPLLAEDRRREKARGGWLVSQERGISLFDEIFLASQPACCGVVRAARQSAVISSLAWHSNAA